MVRQSRVFLVLIVALLVAALPHQAQAQVTTGTVLGTVEDEGGAVVPGVTITLKNIDTGTERRVVTDAAGRYRAPGLSLGTYEVRAELTGFKSQLREGIGLTVGHEAVIDFVLPLGRIEETVTVTGEAPLVNTTGSTLSHLVDEKAIRDLPLNGRDYTQLVLLQPGVTLSRASNNSANVGQGLKISVAGARPNQNLFTLDGTDYNDALNNTPASAQGVMTGVETVKEFRVLTNTMSAEYGRAAGGVFNVVTKSGTNELHGSAFEFFRDDALDSKNYFDDEKPPFRRNQFGGSLGGTIVRNKTFFFGSYEGLRETKGITLVATVPDDAARLGILPGRAPIAVPATIRPYLELFPRANGPRLIDANGRPTGAAEFRGVMTRRSDQDFAMLRIDHVFSERDSMFARYLFDDSIRDEPLNFPDFPNITLNRKHVLTVEEKRIFSSNVLNEVRFGFSRSSPREDVNPVNPYNEIAFVPGQAFGELQVTGLTEVGTDRNNPKTFAQDLYQVTDNLYITIGRHALKTGFNFEHFRYDGFSDSRSRGRLRFRSLADFLAGTTNVFEVAKPGSDFERHYRQSLFGAYLQDDFRVSDRLVLNLGVRWEFVTTPKERDGKVSNLRKLTDAAVVVGDPLFLNPTKKNVAPRLGFAWDLRGNGKTALHGGFGIFYEQPLFYLFRNPIFRSLPFVDRARISRPALPIDMSRVGSAGIPETEPLVYDMKSSYLMHYNLNVQHELPGGSVISVAYVGSRGRNLLGQGDTNIAIPQIVNGQEFFPAGAPRRNPNFAVMRSILQGFRSEYNGVHVGFYKRPGRGPSFQASYTLGYSNDNRSGGGGRLEWRNGQSRTFDPYNFDRDWGRSDFDVRHNLVFNVTYELPFGGSSFGQGWQVNAIATLATGVPFTPIIPGDPDRDGSDDNQARPNVVPGVSTTPQGGQSAEQWFNPAAFAFPGLGFRGNAGRNILDGPGLAVVDFALVKTQKLAGRTSLQIRFEVFNLFNKANFDIPSNDPDGAAVFDDRGGSLADTAKIFNTSTDAREVQLGIRFLF